MQEANSCLMQEWFHMAEGLPTVECSSGSELKESRFRSIDLPLALSLKG